MNTSPPVVSIITRTKNRAILLRRAIKSVVSQSYPHWQLIIVNDGGDPVAVHELAHEFEADLSGKSIIIDNPESLGMEAASNRGLKTATGKYTLIHDDDDSLHPSFLERMVDFAETNDSWGVVCHSIRILEAIKCQQVFITSRDVFNPELRTINLFKILEGNMFPPISFMYRREVFDAIGYYDEALPVLGDWDFNIRFMAKYDIDVLPEPLAYYHHRLDSTGHYGNSVIAGLDKHEKYLSKLRSKYLRHDIDQSITGIGELLNVAQAIRGK